MADSVADVTLTSPSGASRELSLEPTEPGVWEKSIVADELGLWRATDGQLDALTDIGPANPREFAEVTSTTDVMSAIANATRRSRRAGSTAATGSKCRASSRCDPAAPIAATTGSA